MTRPALRILSVAFNLALSAAALAAATIVLMMRRPNILLAASCLIAAGAALYGGAIGILGSVGALFYGAWCLWFVQVLAKAR